MKSFQPHGKSFVEEMMVVNLEHEKYSTSFTVSEELLILFLPSDQDKAGVLRDMYKKTVDKEHGDTFAHVFARLHESNKLHKLMENDYIDPILNKDEVEEKKGLTFFDITSREFLTMNPLDFKTAPEKARKIACCYQTSLKYVMLKQKNWKDFDVTNNCRCGKHQVLREWGVDNAEENKVSIKSKEKLAAGAQQTSQEDLDPEESKYAQCSKLLKRLLTTFLNWKVDAEAVPFWS